jgi:hypothetical protein
MRDVAELIEERRDLLAYVLEVRDSSTSGATTRLLCVG